MSPLKTSLILGLLSAAVTAGGLRYFHRSRVRDLESLQAQNQRLRFEAYQSVQGRVGAKPSTTGPAPAVGPAEPATQPAPAGRTAEYYRNEGNATPLATLQTFAWAGDRGDTAAVLRLLHIDATARPKAEAFMASLPENVRAHWKTVDEMAAALLTESIMARPFPNADILETATVESLGPDRVKLRLPNVPRDGTVYQKTSDGWKYVVTEQMVDDYLRRAQAQAGANR